MNNFETGVAVGYLLHKGTSANLDSTTFSVNGTYTPTAPIDGWNSVTVNVPQSAAVVQSLTATTNGTYNAPQGVDGYNPVTVAVPVPTLTTLNANENRTYTAPANTAYNTVVVNVPTYEDEYEHMVDCCDAVVAALQAYDPDFDPQDCDEVAPEIDKVVEDNKGYEFPPGTNPTDPDFLPLVGGNPITDETLGLTITPVIYQNDEWVDATTTRIEKPPNTSAQFGLKATDSLGNVAYSGGTDFGLSADGEYLEFLGYSISSGTVTLSYKYHVQTWSGWDDRYPTDTYQWAAVSTFGDTSHTYRVKNQ